MRTSLSDGHWTLHMSRQEEVDDLRGGTIRESVDSLCRDGTDTPIVRVHTKTF